jgi:hypothetical protein
MNLIERARQYLARRRTAYVKTFQGPFGEEVLADLAKFCRANQSTFHSDPRVHAVAEGRREVWLRISQHLNLTDDQLWRMYGQPTRTELNNNE